MHRGYGRVGILDASSDICHGCRFAEILCEPGGVAVCVGAFVRAGCFAPTPSFPSGLLPTIMQTILWLFYFFFSHFHHPLLHHREPTTRRTSMCLSTSSLLMSCIHRYSSSPPLLVSGGNRRGVGGFRARGLLQVERKRARERETEREIYISP